MTSWLARILAGALISALVLFALLMGGLRLAIVYIEYFEPEIQTLLERELTPGIVFTGIGGTMSGFNPVLSIDRVSITLPDRSQPLYIDRLGMEFDLFASLAQRAPVVRKVFGQIEKLELVKDEADNWWISDLALAFDPARGSFPDLQRARAWIPDYLNLSLNRMVVVDRKTDTRHLLTDVSANLNRQQEQYLVKFDASLPEQLGRSLLVKSVFGPEQSLIYVNTSRLHLNPIAQLLNLDTWGLRQGIFDGELWINLAGYHVVAVNGKMLLEDGVVQMAADKKPLRVSYHSRFSAVERNAGWRLTSSFDRLSVNGRNVAGFRSQVEFRKQAGRVLSAWVDRVPLASLPVVAGQWLPAEINAQIAEGRLEGELRDVLLRIDLDRPQRSLFGARARDVSSRAFAGYPGATGIDAEILIGNNRIGARVSGENVSLDFGDHFNAPWELDRLEVDVVGQRGERGLTLALNDIQLRNADVKAVGRAWMEFDQDRRPFTFIRADFEDARASSVGKYLPRKYLPQKIQQWLDRGIKGGIVPAGKMLYHGRLRDIRQLERKRAVEFYVDFTVEDAEVLFSPDWLPAKDGRGHVQFHNVGLRFDLDNASYDRIENARVRGGIEDFRQPELKLHIDTDAATGDTVRSWLSTPVGRHFNAAMRRFTDFGGKVATSIDVALPLKGDRLKLQTLTRIDFKDASAVADDWALNLSQINGRLEARGEMLQAQQIDALFYDDPIKVNVAGNPADGHTRVGVRGLIESSNLLRKLPVFLNRQISGKSDWRVDLDFGPRSRASDEPYMRLEASSQLQNSVIALPRPLHKPAEEDLPVTASVDFREQQISFLARIGDRLQTRGSLEIDDGNKYRLDRLDLAFSSNLVTKPRPGVNVYGYIDEISLGDWMGLIDPERVDGEIMLQTANLKIARLHALGREIEGLQVSLRQKDGRFVGNLDALAINGNFDLPRHPSPADPALVELDYLRIDAAPTQAGPSPLKPAQLVDFNLSSKVLRYHGMLFQDLLVQARVDNDSLYIDKLGLHRDRLELKGKGQWDYDPENDTQLSSVTMTVRGPGLGEAINGIGFGDTMRGGTLDFQGGFTWPAPIMSFDIERLTGDAKLRIDEGVLNNVEPGSGRFVGLLSLSALPRRLSLDFSDVLIKGMEFNKITGTYHLEDGILYTQDTRMNGPAASIKISGETNISNHSYNQNIKVTPKIRQTLPVIGAVSAGSTVGWGLLLLQNLFKKAIDKAVEVEYQVTGTWEDPKIELIKAVDENYQNLPGKDEIPPLEK